MSLAKVNNSATLTKYGFKLELIPY